MRKRVFILTISLFSLLTILVACQNESEEVEETSAEETAELFLTSLSEEKYAEAYDQLDKEMKETIEEKDLVELWDALEETAGEHIEFEYKSTDTEEEYEIVYIASHHSKEDLVFMVTVTKDQEIAGFFLE